MNAFRFVPVAVLAAACASAAPDEPAVTPAPQPEQGTFTLAQGGNTVITERFRRTAELLEAEFTLPDGGRASYTAQLRPDASVSEMELRQFAAGAAPDAAPAATAAGAFRGDSVYLTQRQGGSTQTAQRATVAGVVPYVNPSPSLMEQVIRRARALGGASVEVPVWIPSGGGQNARATVAFPAADSAVLTMGGVEIRVRVDAAGRLLGGVVPAQNLTITRTDGS